LPTADFLRCNILGFEENQIKTIKDTEAGRVWKIIAAVGQEIDCGNTTMVLESMEMELPVEANNVGKIVRFLVAESDVVDETAQAAMS